jgi:uncharacterized protein (UPF0548 family)
VVFGLTVGETSGVGVLDWANTPLTSAEMPIRARRPGEEELACLCAEVRDRHFTYDQVGQTRGSRLPDGYHHVRAVEDIGHGAETWARAQDALRTWQGHRYTGASITPSQPSLDPGSVVIISVKVGPLFVVAPCRIVYTTVEADRFGFAYGTLPGHPEQGEESFHVARSAGGAVTFEILAFSRPAAVLARLGGPIARMTQQHITRRYLEGVRTHVARAA